MIVCVVEPSIVCTPVDVLVFSAWSRFKSAAVVEFPSATFNEPLPSFVSVRRMPSPVPSMLAWTPMFRRLMVLTTSPTVCTVESTISVTEAPKELVSVNVPWATPAPPLSAERAVFIETVCRCRSPLLTLETAPSTAMPSFVAVESWSPGSLATIMFPEPPLESTSSIPFAAALICAVMPVPAPLMASITSPSVCAEERLTTTGLPPLPTLPLRSVRSIEPSCPKPCPPLRLLSSGLCRPPRIARPVIVLPLDATFRPRSCNAEPFRTCAENASPPLVLSVITRRLLASSRLVSVEPMLAVSSACRDDAGGVDLVDNLPERRRRVPRGERSTVTVSPLAKWNSKSGRDEFVETPAPSFSARDSGCAEGEDVRSRGRGGVDVDAGQSERRSPCSRLPTSCTTKFDFTAVGAVWSVKTMRAAVGRRGDVDHAVVVDRVEHVADGWAEERSIVVDAPLRSVIAILPGVKPAPPLSESNEALWLRFAP